MNVFNCGQLTHSFFSKQHQAKSSSRELQTRTPVPPVGGHSNTKATTAQILATVAHSSCYGTTFLGISSHPGYCIPELLALAKSKNRRQLTQRAFSFEGIASLMGNTAPFGSCDTSSRALEKKYT